MRFLLASLALAACVTEGPVGTQLRTAPETVRVERPDGTYLLDVSRAEVGSRSVLADLTGNGASYCAMAIDLRADGTVARVKMLGSRSDQLEITCRRSAYDWRIRPTRDGAPTALDGVQAAIVIGERLDESRGVAERRAFGARIVFDTAEIAALRNR